MAPVPAAASGPSVTPSRETALRASNRRKPRRRNPVPWPLLAIGCLVLFVAIGLTQLSSTSQQKAPLAETVEFDPNANPAANRPVEEVLSDRTVPEAASTAPNPVHVPPKVVPPVPNPVQPERKLVQPAAPRPRTGDAPPPRPYADGPLTLTDFAADPPANRSALLAYTYCGLQYNCQYRRSEQASRVTMTLASAVVFAEVIPAKSWNLAPEDKHLLAHEQGHFDIAQIFAVRFQRSLEQQMTKGTLQATRATADAAKAALDAEIARQYQSLHAQFIEEQTRYDDETNHGIDRTRQQQWRERILAEIERLP